jgi:hypothetical protein
VIKRKIKLFDTISANLVEPFMSTCGQILDNLDINIFDTRHDTIPKLIDIFAAKPFLYTSRLSIAHQSSIALASGTFAGFRVFGTNGTLWSSSQFVTELA